MRNRWNETAALIPTWGLWKLKTWTYEISSNVLSAKRQVFLAWLNNTILISWGFFLEPQQIVTTKCTFADFNLKSSGAFQIASAKGASVDCATV